MLCGLLSALEASPTSGLVHSGLPAMRAAADPGPPAGTSTRRVSLQPNWCMQKEEKVQLSTGYGACCVMACCF